jgi:hypothetical protein
MATKKAVKRKRGQRPGSMHIDRRAERLLGEHISDGPDDESLDTQETADWLGVSTLPRDLPAPGHRPALHRDQPPPDPLSARRCQGLAEEAQPLLHREDGAMIRKQAITRGVSLRTIVSSRAFARGLDDVRRGLPFNPDIIDIDEWDYERGRPRCCPQGPRRSDPRRGDPRGS